MMSPNLKSFLLFSFILLLAQSSSFAQGNSILSKEAFSVDSLNSTIPACINENSDSDGDGWGWENSSTCKVGGEYEYVAHPICKSASSDPDEDGWGWENGTSCKVDSEVNNSNQESQNEEILNSSGNLETNFINTSVVPFGSEVIIEFEFTEPRPAFIEYGFSPDNLQFQGPIERNNFDFHKQRLKNLDSDTKYYFVINSEGLKSKLNTFNTGETEVVINEPKPEPATSPAQTVTAPVSPTITEASSSNAGNNNFSELENSGLANACYRDEDHYVAEYLYQNPDVCYWKVENVNGEKQIIPLEVPAIPQNAKPLPAPSGGDDTKAIERLINAAPNQTFYGTGGTYKLDSLDIRQDGTVIYDMPSIPANTSVSRMIHINRANDVKLFDSPQDGKNNPNFYLGIQAEGDRFHLVRSGLSNMFHKGGKNGGGVNIRHRQEDFHIACNTYKNILSQKSGTGTARANAIWYNGGNVSHSGDGYIVNNIAENLQSTGDPVNGGKDAEFLTMQSFSGHDGFVRVFANRGIDAGKRLAKFQATGGAKVLSNYYEWKTNETPELGRRTRLAIIGMPGFEASNVIVRNNRFKINGNKNWSYVFINASTNGAASNQENVHFDCNDIEINNPWNGEGYDQIVFTGRDNTSGSGGTDSSMEPSNSTIENNHVYGRGGVNYHYWMGQGYDLNSGPLQPKNNTFNLSGGSPHQGIERKN